MDFEELGRRDDRGPIGAYGSAPAPPAELELVGPAGPPRSHPLLRVLLTAMVVAVVATAGVLVATGSTTKSQSPMVVLSEAAGRTTGSGTSRVSAETTMTIGGETRKL